MESEGVLPSRLKAIMSCLSESSLNITAPKTERWLPVPSLVWYRGEVDVNVPVVLNVASVPLLPKYVNADCEALRPALTDVFPDTVFHSPASNTTSTFPLPV